MRAHTTKLSAIGTTIGLVLLASAVTPASAAKPTPPAPTVSSSYGCSSLNGTTVTESSAAFTGVALRAGESITVTVSPARAGDSIFLTTSIGLNLSLHEAPATSGLVFTALADGVYNVNWSLKTTGTVPSDLMWSFNSSCSSTTVSPSPTPTETTKPGKGNGKGKG